MYEIVDRSMDNLSVDSDGFVWSAGPCLSRQNFAGVASLIFYYYSYSNSNSIPERVDPRFQTFLEPINTFANDCSALLYEHRPWRRTAWGREI